MKFRLLVVATVSLGVVSAVHPALAQSAKRYHLELKTSAIQDLSAMGQGEQKQEFTLTGQVSISATDSANGQSVSVVMDSLQASPGAPLPPALVQGLVGTTWTGFRAPTGRVAELKPTTEVPGSQLVEGALMQLFPPMVAGTAGGKAWTDTVDVDQDGMGIRTVINFETSNDTHEGKQAVRLAGASSSAISGVQESPQGNLTIAGTGSGTISWLIAGDGSVVTGTFSQDQALEVSVPALPAPIPVKVHNEGTSAVIR
jgi:hypothetical protein